jgi:PPOX class probable F420-dependent enzyme
MDKVPASHEDLLRDEKRAFAYLATIMPNGTPQVTPLWFNTDGKYFLINTTVGRIKDHNMKKRPNVALTIQDPDEPYRYLQIRGKAVEYTTEGASEHIDQLSMKYRGTKYSGWRPGMQRIIYKILPEHVDAHLISWPKPS